MAKAKRNGVTVYTYYRDVNGQDPMVSKVLEALDGGTNEKKSVVIKRAKVGLGTVANWRKKKTRRPQLATMAAILGAVGKQFTIVNKRK